MEACSLQILGGKLVYKMESERVNFEVGERPTGGENPRLVVYNNCPLLLINNLNSSNKRNMYIHNLETD